MIIFLIQKTLEWDKEKYKSYRKQLEVILNYRDDIQSSGEYFWKWLAAQVFMTFMLLAGVYLFLSI